MVELITDMTKLFPGKTAKEKKTARVGLASKRAAKTYREQPQYGAEVAGLASKIRGETVQPRRGLSNIFADELIKEGLVEEALKIQEDVKEEQREDALATFTVAGFLSKQGNKMAAMDLVRREIGTVNAGLGTNLKVEDLTDEAQEGLGQAIEALKDLGVNVDVETMFGVNKDDIVIPDEATSSIRGSATLLDVYEKLKSIGPLGNGLAKKIEDVLFKAKGAGGPGKKIGSTYEVKKGNKILTYEVIGTKPDGTAETQIIAEAPRLASETGTDLTPESLDVASLALLESGQMPAVGRTSRIRVQILNNAPKIAKEYGLEPKDISLAGRKMVYDSNKKALADLTSRKVQILAFEETANLNLDMARKLSKKVGRSGIPIVNAWINAGRRAITGNVDLSNFDAAIRVAINEVAKITSSATGGAVTSDTARKEFEDLLRTAMTDQQVEGVIDTLQADMDNRIIGFNTQVRETKEAIRLFNPKKKKEGTEETSTDETKEIGGITYIKKNGKWYTQ